MRPAQIGVAEVRVAKIGGMNVGAAQVCIGEDGSRQLRAGEPTDGELGELRPCFAMTNREHGQP
jgi:hypothetical protein